jgi:prolipoprotein diacylglyceryltransferase
MIPVVGALVGGRLYYLAEHGQMLEPDEWFGTRGFTFYGGLIAAALGIGAYLWRARLSVEYLDLVAFGLPLGIAIGRIGDVINGEHYGPATDFILGVRNTHQDAEVPSPDVAYHSGGLYEVLIGLVVFVAAPAAGAPHGHDVAGGRPAGRGALPGVLRALRLRDRRARPGDRPVDERRPTA